jgi:hypothetical protein
MTNVNGFIDRWNVKGPKGVPIDGHHVNGQVFVAKDHGLMPIRIKLKLKLDVRIKFLLPKSGIGVPLLVHIVRPPCVDHHPYNAHCSCRMRRL